MNGPDMIAAPEKEKAGQGRMHERLGEQELTQ